MKKMAHLLYIPLVLLLACDEPAGNGTIADTTEVPVATSTGTTGTTLHAPTTKIKLEPSERDAWQKPEELMAMMDNDLTGLVIADLFADDGYFTFRLVAAGAHVIAIENDPAKVAQLEAKKKEFELTDEQLTIRAVPVGDPGIAPGEVDVAVIVHQFAGIKDKKTYFEMLRRGMLPPRPLFVIEWQKRETPVGPPVAQRLNEDEVMDMLGGVGFTDIGAHSLKMPYQVLYFASDPIDEGSDME